MSDLSAQIGELLSDPQTMEQIKALSGLFGQSAPAPPAQELPEQKPAALPSSLGGADALPAIMKFMPLITSLKEDDDATRLLRAVKPFLSEARQEKLEQAIKILRIIRIVPLLRENDLLNIF